MKTLFTVYTRKNLEKITPSSYRHPVRNEGRFHTQEEAQALADAITSRGEYASAGTYYIFSADEWKRNPYTDTLPDETGTRRRCTSHTGQLIYEGIHFEIV